ncbi:hypothetical protein C6571_14585 [Simplicispira suum]|uniref:Uncharacterized protein n=1 Tax=Simplicispira suum TaxID=2109915 RepID=A0A2S0N2J4_9BURK|nr:hypothetical protein C6571_14585 [Simplicispira suum]
MQPRGDANQIFGIAATVGAGKAVGVATRLTAEEGNERATLCHGRCFFQAMGRHAAPEGHRTGLIARPDPAQATGHIAPLDRKRGAQIDHALFGWIPTEQAVGAYASPGAGPRKGQKGCQGKKCQKPFEEIAHSALPGSDEPTREFLFGACGLGWSNERGFLQGINRPDLRMIFQSCLVQKCNAA